MKFDNVITIHLRRFKSVEDFERLFEDNNITTLNAKETFNIIADGWTKVFLDKTTGGVIGYVHESSNDIHLDSDFEKFLHNAPSITFSKKELDVDTILEKIKAHGINSLSKREKDYLDAQYS